MRCRPLSADFADLPARFATDDACTEWEHRGLAVEFETTYESTEPNRDWIAATAALHQTPVRLRRRLIKRYGEPNPYRHLDDAGGTVPTTPTNMRAWLGLGTAAARIS